MLDQNHELQYILSCLTVVKQIKIPLALQDKQKGWIYLRKYMQSVTCYIAMPYLQYQSLVHIKFFFISLTAVMKIKTMWEKRETCI